MGGITRALFGGSKSTGSSENKAFGQLSSGLGGNIGLGNSAMGALASMLGLGDPAAGKAATDNFLGSTGYQTMLDGGSKAITGNAASKGLLNSGATGKALTQYGQDLGQTKINELMGNMTKLGEYGLGSAGVISGAGNTQQSKSVDSGKGIFNSLLPMGLQSDNRLKNIIKLLGEDNDGLKIYEYEYKSDPGTHYVGVMAQDVKELRPYALGAKTPQGYMTVIYRKLGLAAGFPAWGRVVEEEVV